MSKGGDKAQLSANHAWQINQIDTSDVVSAGHISKFGDAYVFELLGRNGEPQADQQVVFTMHFTGFSEPVHLPLRTDDKGRDLPLKPGPTWILLQPQGESLTWSP